MAIKVIPIFSQEKKLLHIIPGISWEEDFSKQRNMSKSQSDG